MTSTQRSSRPTRRWCYGWRMCWSCVRRPRAARDARMLEDYLADLPLPGGARVLEVDCGPGPITRVLAARADVGEIAGIDPSPLFIERAGRETRHSLQHGPHTSLLDAPATRGTRDSRRGGGHEDFNGLTASASRSTTRSRRLLKAPSTVAVAVSAGEGQPGTESFRRCPDVARAIEPWIPACAQTGLPDPARRMSAQLLVNALRELVAVWSSDFDHVAGVDHVAVPSLNMWPSATRVSRRSTRVSSSAQGGAHRGSWDQRRAVIANGMADRIGGGADLPAVFTVRLLRGWHRRLSSSRMGLGCACFSGGGAPTDEGESPGQVVSDASAAVMRSSR